VKTLPWLISMAVHGLVLLIGGLSLQQAIVGIAPGRNSIEVNLVASPSESSPLPAVAPEAQSIMPQMPSIPIPLPHVVEITPPSVRMERIPTPDILPMIPPTVTFAPPSSSSAEVSPSSRATAKSSKEHHRNRAPNSGKDSMTAQSLAGAIIDEEPDYLSNPAPIYPEAAREQGEEGVITLDVIVGTDGCAETVKVVAGTGYYLLDDSAREAVQHYRFRPAMLDGIKVRSHVKVPIRFRLDQ
jgi:protein TonB